jgi:hypothetical protein
MWPFKKRKTKEESPKGKIKPAEISPGDRVAVEADVRQAAGGGDMDKLRGLLERWTHSYGQELINLAKTNAIINGQLPVLKWLIQYNPGVDLGVFCHAVRYAKTEVIAFLLELGADANSETWDSGPALNVAARYGRSDVVKLLLAKGACVNQGTRWDQTALMEAAEEGNLESVKALVNRGADPSLKDCDGRTALWYAQKKGAKDVEQFLKALV